MEGVGTDNTLPPRMLCMDKQRNLGKTNVSVFYFGLEIEIVANKLYFGTETAYHVRNLVAYLVFEQNTK